MRIYGYTFGYRHQFALIAANYPKLQMIMGLISPLPALKVRAVLAQLFHIFGVTSESGGALASPDTTPYLVVRFTFTSGEQFKLAMCELSSRKESAHNHPRRQPLEGKGIRRRLVSVAARKLRSGELKSGKLFREAAELDLREFDIIPQEQRSPTYPRGQHSRTKGHLIPFFGSMVLP